MHTAQALHKSHGKDVLISHSNGWFNWHAFCNVLPSSKSPVPIHQIHSPPDVEYPSSQASLLVILVGLVVDDVEELELVDALGGRDHAEPVAELLLLEELLRPAASHVSLHPTSSMLKHPALATRELACGAGNGRHVQVLEVAAGQFVVGNDLDLALTSLLDHDIVAQVVGAALDLDAVLEELLEGGDVEDLVASGLLSVDDELRTRTLAADSFPRHHPSLPWFTYLLGLLLGLARLLLLLHDDLAYCTFPGAVLPCCLRAGQLRAAPTAKRCHVHTA